MKINADLVGVKLGPLPGSWDSRDCALYALGIGAGQEDPLRELEFTTYSLGGRQQVVYPTFGVLAGGRVGVGSLLEVLGDAVDPGTMLHGEQKYEQLRPFPTEATVVITAEITAVWDKGNATVIETVSEIADVDGGEPYCRSTQAMFFRGIGGWGGERGPSSRPKNIDGAPDRVLRVATRPDQALFYRLSGDNNPLHFDPEFAARAGFDRPILHGLCTYGVVGRKLLAEYAGSDPQRFVSLSGRFSRPAFPGDTLRIDAWQGGEEVSFVVRRDNGEVLLSNGEFVLHE
ncbi:MULTISPECIES: MaoC/PaaZ C-terminal domain-containing protein [unclassified Pseudofrankia]|uniref:MaoC/PaaZ C-terminal domain-containing protein n=1 Tax=unclassified Pseudofrankia TaxID=2994372 RepID=UPI0008D9E255|nr:MULTISPECIES: MaoC/PaaZ C-terminal domain-containing protein [unclassified Pseudofrankia]MDT3446815.1 MaoC/PaaZ C-terminal domain-containing protein [Pseudofrankia sp. BMG5.37]OHV56673.1 hypothetical protein BCD48_43715 [Pseudofrankia sp. BMG5.36]